MATAKKARGIVELEEIVTRTPGSNNGASPLWCYGSPALVRYGDEVFLSVSQTGKVPEVNKGYCNCRWQLWRREDKGKGWRIVRQEPHFDQREPCPLAGFPDGRLFLSVNPLRDRRRNRGPCDPHLLQFLRDKRNAAPTALRPVWAEGVRLTEHSYRGLAVDAENGELLLLNIHASESGPYFPSFRDAKGNWHPLRPVEFPIRACYPQAILADRAAHILAIGDIVEPVKKWREIKWQVLQRSWDYAFRRLFYVHTPDILKRPFARPLEIDTVETTAGHIRNLDLYLDGDGSAHLLYLRQPHQYAFLRDKFFPGQPMKDQLVHVVVRDGKVKRRQVLMESIEGSKQLSPGYGRLHATPDGRLYAVVYAERKAGKGKADNYLLEIRAKGSKARPVALGMKHPLASFFTNTPRGGSKPDKTLDLFGVGATKRRPGARIPEHVLRYARIRLTP